MVVFEMIFSGDGCFYFTLCQSIVPTLCWKHATNLCPLVYLHLTKIFSLHASLLWYKQDVEWPCYICWDHITMATQNGRGFKLVLVCTMNSTTSTTKFEKFFFQNNFRITTVLNKYRYHIDSRLRRCNSNYL